MAVAAAGYSCAEATLAVCGFFAIVRRSGGRLPAEEIVSAVTAMQRRGPDDEGYAAWRTGDLAMTAMRSDHGHGSAEWPHVGTALAARDWNVVLGHRRLAILDLSTAGHQPMASVHGGTCIAYNGEIYNFVELRAQLEAVGHRFRTRTDTEVLLAAYEEWGEGMLDRIEGMYAFALLSIARRTLFVARDPFGIKPLYQAETDDFLAYSSSMDSLLRLPGVSRRADRGVALDYLWLGERRSGERTFVESIKALPAAHCEAIDVGVASSLGRRRYWEYRLDRPLDVGFVEASELVRECVLESVKGHMHSDVPLGSCLSGGLDSSIVIAAMRQAGGDGRELHTFSFISEDPAQSEERYIDMIGGTTRHKVAPTGRDVDLDIDRLLEAQEVPFGTLSIYAQFKVFELARRHGIKVMLDGQGADEIFGGYDSILLARAATLLNSGHVAAARRVLHALQAPTARMRLRNWLAVFARVGDARGVGGMLAAVRRFTSVPPWIDRQALAELGTTQSASPGFGGSVREELRAYMESVTLPQLLRYEDQNSMYFSIESRVPYCSRRLAELAGSLPDRFLVGDDGRTKAVLRSAFSDLIPHEILERRKLGFVAPDQRWLAENYERLVSRCRDASSASPPFMDLESFAEWGFAQVARGSARPVVWRGLNLVLWASGRGMAW